MTPLTSSRNLSDDFVLTLSDHQDLSSVSEDSGSDAIAGPNDNIATGIVKSTNGKIENKSKRKSKGEGKKRKRVAEEKQDHGGRGSKKAKWKGTEMNGLEGSDSESGEVGEDDGAMDPDFEFDVAGLGGGILGGVEEFDGWGVDDTVEKGTRGGKKGVDLEGIIERRRKKDDVVEEVAGEAGEAEPEGESDEESLEGLDDDELLAEDGFGMGVTADENEDSGDEEDEEAVDGGMGSEDQASDSDSVASPVAHPDDLGAGSDSDESDAPEEKARQKAFFAPEEAEPSNSTSSTSTFQSFSLSRPILRGIASVGFTTPTPIQHKTIPVALRGIDVVGGAVTGSGKTAAFIIPILERLLYRPRKVPTSRVAVLMPTRELAVQCFNVATKLASYTDITFCQLVGGFSLREQEMVLKKRPDVIIATPGRFIDHMRNSASFTIDTLEILVLDEADRMLEDGFADELNEILTTIPKSRQTMLFSATMTDTVDKLIRVGLNRPARLMVDAKKRTVTTLVQEFVRLRPGREDKRMGYLLLLCKTIYANRVIVFFRQKKEAHRARIIFGLLGIKAGELHGSMTQEQRIKAVESFRSGVHTHLLATDLASRGLDISNVHTVLNYEAPQSHSIYLHRVGRTARAGRSGRACTLAAEPDRKVVKAAVKAARAQGAKVVSRVIETEAADSWAEKVAALDDEVDEILKEEKEEKQLMQIEMNVTKGENIIKYEDEIKGHPKRTWFENEADKRAAKTAGRKELNGPEIVGKEKKGKLSGKDKKKLDLRRERTEGKVWKKGRENRKPGGARGADAKGKVKSKAKSKSKPTQKGKMGRRRR